MIKVHCSKCGITGTSKNPLVRSTFLDDQDFATLEAILPTLLEDTPDGKRIVIRKQTWEKEPSKEDITNQLRYIANILDRVVESGLAQSFVCDHNFVPLNAEEESKIVVW